MLSEMNKNNGLELAIIGLVTLICLGISFYQTSIGYQEFFGSIIISSIFALVIVLLLFFLNYKLRSVRRNNGGVATVIQLLILYCIFTSVSFAGNFNSFYTSFMKNELIKAELVEKKDELNKLQTQATIILSSQDRIAPQIDGLVSQLEIQINNPDAPGCGKNCESILTQIESILGESITRLKSNNNKQLFQEYKKIIDKQMEIKLRVINDKLRKDLIIQINNDTKSLTSEIDEVIENPSINGIHILKKVVDEYKNIGIKTEALVGEPFKFNEAIKVDNEEIGRISQTFYSASKNANHWGTWLCVIISVFVDLFVPIFILVVTVPNSNDLLTHNRREPRRI